MRIRSGSMQEEISPELASVIELINGLSLDTQSEERLKTLKTLRTNILPLSQDQVQRMFYSSELNLNNLFYIFSEINNNTDESTQSDDIIIKNETVEIFEKLISSFGNIGLLLETFNKELTELYSHAGNEKLQLMCLEKFCLLIKQIRCGKKSISTI